MSSFVRATRLEAPATPPQAITDPDILAGYLQDASRLVGHAQALYRPRDVLEAASVLQSCHASRTPVTVVARQTSTTGSSVPQGGVILSMERLTGLKWVDPARQRARAEAGILLGEFQQAVEAQGLLYPPDPTSRHESTLGASVACNASGARTFQYGPTRGYVQGLSVVTGEGYLLEIGRGEVQADDQGLIHLELPDGEVRVLSCPTWRLPAVKHAAGYHSANNIDLIDLFIGSEGTLGVIVAVEVGLLPLPPQVLSVLACWPDEASALQFVQAARAARRAGNLQPRCLEWLDGPSLRIVGEHFPGHVIPPEAGAAVFFEQECQAGEEDGALEGWYELLAETGALLEAEGGVIVADSPARTQLLYDLRHAVPAGVNEKAARNGMPKLGTDLAVPDEALETMMGEYAAALRDVPAYLGMGAGKAALEDVLKSRGEAGAAGLEALTQCQEEGALRALWLEAGLPLSYESATFGHIGDNHVHVNLLPTTAEGLRVAKRLYGALTAKAIALGGTVSAEHGIGKNKRAALEALLGAEAIEGMKRIKRVLDPGWILGVGNLFEGG